MYIILFILLTYNKMYSIIQLIQMIQKGQWLELKITLKGKENVYEQIVNEYKRFISLNVLRLDDKLPSCRELAKELGINPNTVSKAYSVLEADGYIKILPKKGVYVNYQNDKIDTKKIEIEDFFKHLKENKVSLKEIKEILNDVYGGDDND